MSFYSPSFGNVFDVCPVFAVLSARIVVFDTGDTFAAFFVYFVSLCFCGFKSPLFVSGKIFTSFFFYFQPPCIVID